jgi:hypothetical protein
MPPDDNNTNNDGVVNYTTAEEDVLTDLDPDLQSIILARRNGDPLPAHLVETVEDNGQVFTAVDVIARLKEPGQKIPGLWVVQEIGPIVTGLVDVDRIAEVREQVDSLKAARPLNQTLSTSVPEVSASQAQIRALTGRPPVDGSNVVVGFVDYGCGFAHPHFRKLDGQKETRIRCLWDQRGGSAPESPEDFGYGREFDEGEINNALLNADPALGPAGAHQALGYQPSDAHGTQVMDIAVGNGGGVNPPGVAPGADIIFVETALGELEPGESFGNSRHLVDAVRYIFKRAEKLNKPAVVNISLSSNAGPHDGSTPVEQAFDCMLQEPGRAIVMAAGNAGVNKKHLRRRAYPGQTLTLVWNIPVDDRTSNKVEIWYDGRRTLELKLRSELNAELGPFRLGTTQKIMRMIDNEEQVAGRVFHRRNDSGNGDNNIVILFEPLMESGNWKIELTPLDRSDYPPFDVHAWIERDGGQNSKFPEQQPSDNHCTLGTLACGHSTIAVSAYNSFEPHGIMESSAAGPTRDGKLKPEVSAPGVGIKAAALLKNSVAQTSGGTSLSAPHVAGLIALMMQRAGRFLTTEETRSLVMNSSRHLPPSTANAWAPRFGAGRIDAAGSKLATPLPPPPPPPSPVVAVVEHEETLVTGVIPLNGTGVNADAPAPDVVTVGISVETVSTVVSSLSNPSVVTTVVNADSNGAGTGEGEVPPAPRPFTTGH